MKQMNYFKMLLAGALLVALTSCADINPVENQSEQAGKGTRTENIGLRLEPGTKVTLSDDATPLFAWELNDQVSVWTATADNVAGAFQVGSVVDVSGEKMLSLAFPEGQKRFHYAVYPSSVSPAYNVGTGALTITLPRSYNLSKVQDTRTPLPMVAANTDGNALVFYNVGAMLRLTVNKIPSDATGLEIMFPGKKVNGSFVVSNPGTSTSTISTAYPDDGEDKIRVLFTAGTTTATVNIPLPTGEYEDVFITPILPANSNNKVAAVRRIPADYHVGDDPGHVYVGSYTAVRAKGKKLTATLVSFSVSDTKKVVFAPGNLQATTSNLGEKWIWGFAVNQFDRIGVAAANTKINGNGTVSENGTVDLFGLSNGALNSYGIHNSTAVSDYIFTFTDWGQKVIDGYDNNFWETLSSSEADYLLFNGRSGNRYVKATMFRHPVVGILILPDDFVWNSTTMGSVPATFNPGNGVDFTDPTIDDDINNNQWEAIQAAGAIFLPLAGVRSGSSVDLGTKPDNGGRYRFSDGYILDFTNCSINNYPSVSYTIGIYNGADYKYAGYSVRLVHVL